MLLMLLLGVCLGIHVNRVRRQKAAVLGLTRLGAQVFYDHDIAEGAGESNSTLGPHLRRVLGEDFFSRVGRVYLARLTDEQLAEVRPHLMALGELWSLDLGQTAVTDRGVENLAGLEIRDLTLGSGVGDVGTAALRQVRGSTGVDLSRTTASDEGLAELREVKALERLSLGSGVTDRGLRHLRAWPKLRALGLIGPQITDDGLKHVGDLIHLEDLRLRCPRLTDAGLAHLNRLTQLRTLWLPTSVTTSAVRDIERQLPGVTVFTSP